MTSVSSTPNQRGAWWALAYAAPAVPFAMLATPALTIVAPIYAKHGALSLSAMGLALIIARVFDALVDPIIGAWSDRTAHIAGGRSLWIQGSIFLAIISTYFWLNPEPDASFSYFLGWSMCICLAWSLFETPHRALLTEVVRDAKGQTKLSAWRTGAAQLGMLGCMVVMHFSAGTSPLGPNALKLLSTVIIPLFILTGLAFHFGTRKAIRLERLQPKPPPATSSLLGGNAIRQALRHKCIHRLLQIIALQGAATGMTAALYFFYMDAVLRIAGLIPMIALVAGGTALLAAWAGFPTIARIGNAKIIRAGSFGLALLLVLFCVISPGKYATASVMLIFVLSAVCATGVEISIISQTAHIVEQDRLETGMSRAGLFYSIEKFVDEISIAIGATVALACVGFGGFDPLLSNGPTETWVLLLCFALTPAALQLAAGWYAGSLISTVATTSTK